MSDSSGDIVIKGGSVQLHFDDGLYHKDQSDPRKYSNPNRRIQRIRIKEKDEEIIFDSGDHPGGLSWTIEVFCK